MQAFVVLGHIHPDGDSIGSQLALGHMLKTMEKDVVMISPDPAPEELQFLPGVNEIVDTVSNYPENYALILLDTPTAERSGYAEIDSLIQNANVTINIDHHVSNTCYADVNWVEAKTSCVGEMLLHIFRHGGFTIDQETATCLYASLLTDTGGFRHANTTGAAFRMAAELVELGIDPVLVSREIYGNLPLRRYKLLSQALNNLALYHENQIAVLSVTEDMFKDTGATLEDCDGLVNYAANIQGTAQ